MMQENIVDILISVRDLALVSKENQTGMTTNIPLLRYQAVNVPSFDGNAKQMKRFLTSCDCFLKHYQNLENVNDPIR